jgi:hypothetical protein
MLVLNQLNEYVYHHFHHTLLHQPNTRREKQLHNMMCTTLKYYLNSTWSIAEKQKLQTPD